LIKDLSGNAMNRIYKKIFPTDEKRPTDNKNFKKSVGRRLSVGPYLFQGA
jgi:hypothetical protein